MQSILREKLLRQSEKLAQISHNYLTDSTSFTGSYLIWLEESEKELSMIRSPFRILLQAEKNRIKSVEDGYIPENIQQGKSIRKVQRALAAQSVSKVSQEIYSLINNIEQQFSDLHEKMSHAVAVMASKDSGLYATLSDDEKSVEKIWSVMATTAETIPMYNYFCAKLSHTDTKYLLAGIIRNIVNQRNG